jgi:hypothetical protein
MRRKRNTKPKARGSKMITKDLLISESNLRDSLIPLLSQLKYISSDDDVELTFGNKLGRTFIPDPDNPNNWVFPVTLKVKEVSATGIKE